MANLQESIQALNEGKNPKQKAKNDLERFSTLYFSGLDKMLRDGVLSQKEYESTKMKFSGEQKRLAGIIKKG